MNALVWISMEWFNCPKGEFLMEDELGHLSFPSLCLLLCLFLSSSAMDDTTLTRCECLHMAFPRPHNCKPQKSNLQWSVIAAAKGPKTLLHRHELLALPSPLT